MMDPKNRLRPALLSLLPLAVAGSLGCSAPVGSGDGQTGEPTAVTKEALAPGSAAGFVLSAFATTNGTVMNIPSQWSYNSSQGEKPTSVNTILSLGVGQYVVDFPGLPTLGDVQVSSFGSSNERCKVVHWAGSNDGLEVFVNCFSFAGVPVNSLFTLHFSQRSDVVPQGEAEQGAYVWMNNLTGSNNPSTAWQWTSTHGANGTGVAVNYGGPGLYYLTFAGINIPINGNANTGTVQVTAYGSDNAFCKVTGWGNSAANVQCFDGTTHQSKDSQFDLVYTNASPDNVRSYNGAFIEGGEPPVIPSYRTHGMIFSSNDAHGYPQGTTANLVTASLRTGGRGAGDYTVRFPGMATNGGLPIGVNVTTFGGFTTEMCQIGGWVASGNDGFATVFCYDSNNNPADEDFLTTYNSPAAHN